MLSQDISTYFGSDIQLYNKLQSLFLGSVSGAEHLSQSSKFRIYTELSKSLSTGLFPSVSQYFQNNSLTFTDNIIGRYEGMLVDHHSKILTQQILSTKSMDAILPVDELVYVQFIEDDMYANRNDLLELLEDKSSELSESVTDYPNMFTFLMQSLLIDIDTDISKFTDKFILPSNILFGNVANSTSVANYIHTYMNSISLSSSDPVNKQLLDSAIMQEFTKVIYDQLSLIYSDSVKLDKLFTGVDNLFTSIIDTNRNDNDRLNTYMSIVQIAINTDAIGSISSILPSFTDAIYSDMSYPSPPMQYFDTKSWLEKMYIDHTTSDTIARSAVCSYYAYVIHAYLDNFAINQSAV